MIHSNILNIWICATYNMYNVMKQWQEYRYGKGCRRPKTQIWPFFLPGEQLGEEPLIWETPHAYRALSFDVILFQFGINNILHESGICKVVLT